MPRILHRVIITRPNLAGKLLMTFTTRLALSSSLLFFACGDVEPKPKELPPNLSTNNTSTNNQGTNNVFTFCVLDVDCVAGEVCENEVCTPTCETDEDCGAGEFCETRINGPGMYCEFGEPANNVLTPGCVNQDSPDEYCESMLGSGATCDTATDECVQPEPAIFAVQIADVTTATSACDTSSPGSDIYAVELRDDQGNTLGWGSLVAENVIITGNLELAFESLDGIAPTLDGDGCVDRLSGNVLSLGCTGSIAVDFLDAAANPVPLETGQTVTVYEYGATCSADTTTDEFTVFTCSNIAAVRDGDTSDCTNRIGTGTGIQTFQIFL